MKHHSTAVRVIQEEEDDNDVDDDSNNCPDVRSGDDDDEISSDISSDDGVIHTMDHWSQEVSAMQDDELMRAFHLATPIGRLGKQKLIGEENKKGEDEDASKFFAPRRSSQCNSTKNMITFFFE